MTRLAATFLILVTFLADVLAQTQVFEEVKSFPSAQRVVKADSIYKAHYRKAAETTAMQCLDQLEAIARDIGDMPLQCAVFDMRADYYSVNNGYNPASTAYYQQAIDFAIKNKLEKETAIAYHKKGRYYYVYKQNTQACQCYLQAQDIIQRIGTDKFTDVALYYTQVAELYYVIGDYVNAKSNLQHALRCKVATPRNRINVINTLGLISRCNKDYKQALDYFGKALNMAKASRDSAWIGIAKGNIGSVYYFRKEYEKAQPLIIIDYRLSLKFNQFLNATIALLRLADIEIIKGRLNQATVQLIAAQALLSKIGKGSLSQWMEYYRMRSAIYEKQGKASLALVFQKKYEITKDSLNKRDNLYAVERVRLKYEIDKSRTQLNRVKTIAEVDAFKRNATIIFLFLIIIIVALVYNRQRLEAKKDKALLEAEKRRIDQELKNAESALLKYTESLMQKNKMIEDFKSEIERLKIKSADEDGAMQLSKMMQVHLMTDDNWNEFKKLFTRVHTTFFYNLRNKYPQLTATDTRLISLIKLNLTNREMADMLGITIDGIKKSKQRLRKKMNLNNDIEMDEAIAFL